MTATEPIPVHPALTPGHYRINPEATRITFRARHLLGLGAVSGRFRLLDGHADIDDQGSTSATVHVAAESFHTGLAPRDHKVRGRGFLDVERHPVITATIERLEPSGDAESLRAHGTLTVRDVTRPLIAHVDQLQRIGSVVRFQLVCRINRLDHGITAARGMASAYLELTVDVVARA